MSNKIYKFYSYNDLKNFYEIFIDLYQQLKN